MKYLSGQIGTINRSGMDARRSLSEYSHYISHGFLNGKLRDLDLRWIEKRILIRQCSTERISASRCSGVRQTGLSTRMPNLPTQAGPFSFSAST